MMHFIIVTLLVTLVFYVIIKKNEFLDYSGWGGEVIRLVFANSVAVCIILLGMVFTLETGINIQSKEIVELKVLGEETEIKINTSILILPRGGGGLNTIPIVTSSNKDYTYVEYKDGTIDKIELEDDFADLEKGETILVEQNTIKSRITGETLYITHKLKK